MSSLYRHKNSPNWYCSYRNSRGAWVTASTKCADRDQALIVCQTMAKADRAAGAKQLSPQRAKEILERALEDIAELNNCPLPTMSVADYFTRWLAQQKEGQLAEASIVRYTTGIRHLREGLGPLWNQPLSALNAVVLMDWRSGLSLKLAPTTAQSFFKIIQFALNGAVQQNLIAKNPAKGLQPLVKRGNAAHSKRRSFTPDEVRLVLKQAEGEWIGMILCGYCTGQRLGDIAGLRWNQVNLQASEIGFTQVKKRGKLVPVPMAAQLEEWFLKAPAPDDPNAFVFPRSGLTNISILSRQFLRLLQKARLAAPRDDSPKNRVGDRREQSELSFHSLRHCLATQLRSLGASEAVAMAILGHESTAVARKYTHIGTDELRPMIAKIASL